MWSILYEIEIKEIASADFFITRLTNIHLTNFALYDNIPLGVIQYGNAPKLIPRFGEPLHGGGYALFNKMKGVILCSFQIHKKGVVRYELFIRTFIVCLLHTKAYLPL